MNIEALKNYVIDKISQQETNTANKIDFFNQMFKCNLIDKQYLQKACINDLYDIKYKENSKTNTNSIVRDTVLDVCLAFDVCERTVYNSIYKYSHIRLKF